MAYGETTAVAAAAGLAKLIASVTEREFVVDVDHVEPYEPGRFYVRELPCLLAVLARVNEARGPREGEVLVIDGYVHLDGLRAGLGMHLHEATGMPVVGIAKTAFKGSAHALPVTRGISTKPLWVTSVGVGVEEAAYAVGRMAGPDRLPWMVKRADALARRR